MATQNRTDGCPQSVAIGIDFGSSKCCVAAVRDGRAHVLENEFGQRTTPSWVAFNSQQRLVGGAALDQAVVNCANTVSGVKRTLGRTYDDVKGLPTTCKIKKCYPNSNFQYWVNYRKRQLQLSPEQITAMMLTKMTDIAKASLGCEVTRAVISVPTCYGNAQRAAIINSAQVAGLEVLQLINETTAAGIAFAHNRRVKTPVTIAVVDFGAGNLDISVMKVEGKSIKVIGASGNPYLGGCNVDEFLVDHCVGIIQQKYGSEVKISDRGRVKLRLACEKAKKTLSRLPEAQVDIESLFENCDVKIPLYRQNICKLIEEGIRSTITGNFERIFREKSIGKDVIDKIVLVGGSRHIPAVKLILEEYFGSHKLDPTVNQDEAVAQGAALRAAALSGAAADIEVADVSSFDVCFSGSSQNKDKFDQIINKFSPVPSSKSHEFNEARGTKMRFFERMFRFDGSKCDADLLSVEFTGSFASSDRFVSAELTLQLNESGMFSASIPSPDHKSRLKLMPFTSHHSYEINNWVKDEGKFRCDAKIEMERVDAEVELESRCYDVQSVLSELELMEDISHDELETSKKAVSNAMKWMTNNIESASLSEFNQKINKVNSLKKDVHRMMNTARKKAIEQEEAAKKQAEMEFLDKQILSFESLLFEVKCVLQDSYLVMGFYPDILEQCKDKTFSLITWKKNIESASLTEVTQKLEELTQVKRKLDQLKANAAREKTRIEAENEAARKREEKELLETQISEYESLLSEVKCTLHDTIFITYLDRQIFQACELKLNSLLAWKEYSDTASITQVSQKLEELTQLKSKVDQMKTDALEEARGKEDAEKQREVELHKERIWSFKSLLCEVKETLDDLHPVSSSYSSKFWLIEASFHRLKDWKEIIEAASVTLVSKKLEEITQLKHEVDQLETDVEGQKVHVTKEVANATLAGDSPKQHTGLRNSSNSSLANRQMTRNVAVNPFLEEMNESEAKIPRARITLPAVQLSLPWSQAHQTTINAKRGRSQSATRPTVEGKKHRSRNRSHSPSVMSHNSKEKEGEQKVSNRERSSLRSRHGSAISKERSLAGLSSSLEGERHHQPKASCEETANEGFPLHQRGSSDRCTEQPTSARSIGSTLDQMRKSAVVNSVTLPKKHSPMVDLARSKGYDSTVTCSSKEIQTASTTKSARTQTDMALLENNRGYGNDTSSDGELQELSVEILVKMRKYENFGILLPLLQIVENTMSNMVNCELCTSIRLPCSRHRSEGLQELCKMINIMPEILSQKLLAKTKDTNLNVQTTTTLESAENVGARLRCTTAYCSKKDNGVSNRNVDSVQGPTAVPRQSSAGVSDTHSSLDGLISTPEGPARVKQSYVPMFQHLGRSSEMETRTCNSPTCSCYRSHCSEKTHSYVPRIAAYYKELNKK